MDILKATIGIVRDELADVLDDIVIERAVVGLFFTGVKLSSGHAGACATPIKDISEAVCCPSSALAMPFPGKLHGRRAADLMDEVAESDGIRRALGMATLNALAHALSERRPREDVEIIDNLDAFDAAEIAPHETVVVVGAFIPFMRELMKRKVRFWVLEKDPSTLKPHEMPFFRHADEAPAVVPQADVVLITGTTLVNDTLESLIALARPQARVVVVGPTVTMIADAFFSRRCDILGGVKIVQPDAFLDVLAEGGSGYHFFGKSALKIVLRRTRASLSARAPAAAALAG